MFFLLTCSSGLKLGSILYYTPLIGRIYKGMKAIRSIFQDMLDSDLLQEDLKN